MKFFKLSQGFYNLQDQSLKVFNCDPQPDFAKILENHNDISAVKVYLVPGDYSEFVENPVLEQDLKIYQTHKKLKNYYFIISPYKVSDHFQLRYKDILTVFHVPEMYAWYLDQKTIPKNPNLASIKERNISKHFLCLNNRSTWYRQGLLYLFAEYGLFDKSYFSYRLRSRNAGQTPNTTFQINHELLKQTSHCDFEKIKNMLPYCNFNEPHLNEGGDWSFGFLEFYNNVFCSIVTESYNEQDVFFTEKTFKTILYKHPFLFYGPKGSLAALRNMGFRTFENFFNESYDNVDIPVERFESLSDQILEVSKWDLDKCQTVLNKMEDILEHNYTHLVETLPKCYENTLKNTIIPSVKQKISYYNQNKLQ